MRDPQFLIMLTEDAMKPVFISILDTEALVTDYSFLPLHLSLSVPPPAFQVSCFVSFLLRLITLQVCLITKPGVYIPSHPSARPGGVCNDFSIACLSFSYTIFTSHKQ